MATLIAHEPSCDAYPPSSSFDVRQLATKQAWQAYIRAPGATRAAYCQAFHEVDAWARSFKSDGARMKSLRATMTTVANGGAFELTPSS